MKTLNVNVSDKVATYRQRDGVIVCGNSDYQIKFVFDSDWDDNPQKTARFIWNGQYVDVDFEGDVCLVPIIHNTTSVSIGVYSGELSTTTPAVIECKKSILCPEVEASAETRKQYADVAELSAQRAEAAADRAEDFEGKCIKDITTTSAEGINEVKVILNDDTVKTFNVKDGVGIVSIVPDASSSDSDYGNNYKWQEYIINFTDGTMSSFVVYNGKNGIAPHVGENGNWWIGDTDTGSKAQGDKGDNAYLSIKDDGNGNVTLETHNKEEILTDDGEGNVFWR